MDEIANQIIAATSAARSVQTVRDLCVFGARWQGSDGEKAARAFIKSELALQKHLVVHEESFPYLGYSCRHTALEILTPDSSILLCEALVYSPSTDSRGIEGPVVNVGEGTPEAYEGLKAKGISVEGKIILSRALRSYQAYPEAVKHGATGFILATSLDSDQIRVGAASYRRRLEAIPGVATSSKGNKDLLAAACDPGNRVRIQIDARTFQAEGCNIVASYRGCPEREGRVIIINHYDSVWVGRGAIDNGTGVAGAIELAKSLNQTCAPINVDFVFVGAEELGFWGSKGYVDRHIDNLKGVTAILCLDSFSCDFSQVEFGVSPDLEAQTREWVDKQHFSVDIWTVPPRPASDHVSFKDLPIPVLWITDRGNDYYHTALDVPENPNLNEESMKRSLRMAAYALARLGLNPPAC